MRLVGGRMSIATIAAEPARLKAPANSVVTLDIERLPGRARHQHRGLTIEGDFWDLGSWKHVIGYRIPPESVVEWPAPSASHALVRIARTTEFASEWGDGREAMLHPRVGSLRPGVVVYGHNVDRFDTKNLNAEWLTLGLNAPSPFKILDTLKEARKTFGFESNTLASLTKRLGIDTKTDKYTSTWPALRGRRQGTAEAQGVQRRRHHRLPRRSSTGCVAGSQAHPHSLTGTADDRPTCNQCWGDNLERNGTKLAQQITYKLYRCGDCGANVQGTRHSRAAITRGAR
jgi:hypothetical protein